MAVESMSHCGSPSVEIQFSTSPLKKKYRTSHGTVSSHTFFSGRSSRVMWNSGVSLLSCKWIPPTNVSGRRRSGWSWQVGWWAGKLLLPGRSPRPLTIIISKHMCTVCCFFFSLFLWLCLCPSSSLWLRLPFSLPSKHPGRWGSLPVENSVFSLLNFPSSGRFLTDSYTSVPLFLLNSLVGLHAGGMRKQHRAVRNHCASCLTLPYDSRFPFLDSLPPPPLPLQDPLSLLLLCSFKEKM